MTLQWPTSLSVNPVDNSLYILDRDIVIELSAGNRLRVVVAAASAPCVLNQPRSIVITTDVVKRMAVSPSGRQLIVIASHQKVLRAVDLLTGHVTRYAVAPGNANLSALAVSHDGGVYVADVENGTVYTVTSPLPAPHHVTGNYEVVDRAAQERYTFNR